MQSIEIDMWVNSWLHNTYGLTDDPQIWDPGDIEEMVQMAVKDYQDNITKDEKK